MAYKTPGVYVQEIALFPPSVAPVATAIPAFVGYTEIAETPEGVALPDLKPVRITSLIEYESMFGKEYPVISYTVRVDPLTNLIAASKPDKRFHLYQAIRQYFDNGGGVAYVISAGTYSDNITYAKLSAGIDAVKAEDEPTLILFPDAVELKDSDDKPDLTNFSELQKQALLQCSTLQDRFCIFDIIQGDKAISVTTDPISDFRDGIGVNNLNYGAAYYPFITTNYSVTVDFRQLAFTDNALPPVAITNLTAFSKNDQEKGLVTAVQSSIAEADKIFGVIDGITADDLRIKGIEAVTDMLLSFQKDIISSTDEAGKKTTLSGWLDTLASVVNSYKKVSDALAADSALLKDIQKLKANKKLTDAITLLVSVEKSAKVIANTVNTRNAAKIKTIYQPIEGGWFGKQADGITDILYDDITAFDDSVLAADDKFTKSMEGALAIVRFLKDTSVTVINGLENMITAGGFYESQDQQRLFTQHQFFKGVSDELTRFMRTIPPSGAIAGVYSFVDNTRGVWKAPANVSLNNVIGPAVKITNAEQDDLNVHATGKSVNAIRSFTGKGSLVWGSRTLTGNDNEWRYVPVRRFFIMVEESVKKATEPFVFENNDANTWVKIRSMVLNFLTLQWRAGALQGSKPEEAFFVNVGLNVTMTALDILEGRLIVEIGMAVVRPAEFIILRFSHKIQDK